MTYNVLQLLVNLKAHLCHQREYWKTEIMCNNYNYFNMILELLWLGQDNKNELFGPRKGPKLLRQLLLGLLLPFSKNA